MRKSLLVVPGLIFLVLGTLAFLISSETKVFVEISPFSLLLIMLFVAGLSMLFVGFGYFILDKLE